MSEQSPTRPGWSFDAAPAPFDTEPVTDLHLADDSCCDESERCPGCGALDPMGDEAAWHTDGCPTVVLVPANGDDGLTCAACGLTPTQAETHNDGTCPAVADATGAHDWRDAVVTVVPTCSSCGRPDFTATAADADDQRWVCPACL